MKKLLQIYQKLSKTGKIIFFVAVGMLVLLAADKLVVRQAYEAIVGLEESRRSEEEAIRTSVYVMNKKRQIEAEAKELAMYVAQPKDDEEEITGLLKILESATNQVGVNLIDVKPGTIKEMPGMKKFYSSMVCESEMEQVATLFHEIETSPKLLKIEKYEIEPKSKDSSLARCSLTVSKTVLL